MKKMDQYFSNKLKENGFVFLPLVDKYVVAISENEVLEKLYLRGDQVSDIGKYIDNNCQAYDGMFDRVDRSVFLQLLGYHYAAKKNNAKNVEEQARIVEEYKNKSLGLQIFKSRTPFVGEADNDAYRQPQ